MYTFKVYHELAHSRYTKLEVELQTIQALEFHSYKTYTEELAGCYLAIVKIQFLDDDEAMLFIEKYGQAWQAEVIPDNQFKEGHRTFYVGG